MRRNAVGTRWLALIICIASAISLTSIGWCASKGASANNNLTADMLIVKSLRSEADVNYQGVQVITTRTNNGSDTKVTKVYHKKPTKYRTELEQLGKSGNRVTIDDGQHLWVYEENSNIIYQDDSPSAGSLLIPWQRRKQLVESNYQANLEGFDKFVNRNAGIVALYPKRSARMSDTPSWRFWIDTETGLTLKSEQFGHDGTVYEVRYFTELSVKSNVSSDLFAPRLSKGAVLVKTKRPKLEKSIEKLAGKTKIPVKMPNKLPMGFELAWGSYVKRDDQSIVRLQYTDGLASISVFQKYPPTGIKTRSADLTGTTSIFESSTKGADITILADIASTNLMKVVEESLGPMGILDDDAQPSSSFVQERLRTVWRMFGLPLD